jgi:hypothetical protein
MIQVNENDKHDDKKLVTPNGKREVCKADGNTEREKD